MAAKGCEHGDTNSVVSPSRHGVKINGPLLPVLQSPGGDVVVSFKNVWL